MKRRIYLSMKSLEEARALWLARFDPKTMLAAREIPTVAARGRVTAAPVMARRSSPAAHQAAMDGFAVRPRLPSGPPRTRPSFCTWAGRPSRSTPAT